MKVIQINTFPNKATGNIMMNIHNYLLKEGHESYVVWGRGRPAQNKFEISIGNRINAYSHVIYTRITDKTGFASSHVTKKLLKKIDDIKPDVIHLHNIHGYYINIKLLFNYIKEKNIKVVWTLHDCWPITGHCAYFDMVNCDKWKKGCYKCVQKNIYPASFFNDNSKWNYRQKKELFNNCDITLVTPSKWLKDIVSQSFLKNYPINVIHNGVDTNVFRPVKSNFKETHNVLYKYMVLGVASEWTERKGLKDFIILNEKLNKVSDKFQIVLVGLTKAQIKDIPSSILGFPRTNSLRELAEIYSAADIYFNPTYEDNFPTTNLESIACGTPVLTYDTGGSPETVLGVKSYIVAKGDIEACLKILLREHNVEKKEQLERKDMLCAMISSYLELYSRILNGNEND